jgi:PAS domain-containing protein
VAFGAVACTLQCRRPILDATATGDHRPPADLANFDDMRHSTAPGHWTRGSAIFALAAGTIALLGWALGEAVLTGASRGLPPIAPLVAVAVAAHGAALLVLAQPRPRAIRLVGAGLAVAGALAALAGLALQEGVVPHPARLEVVTGWMRQPRVLLRVPPTVVTSGALVLLAASLVALALRRSSAVRIAHTVALAPLVVALFTAVPLAGGDPLRAPTIGATAMPANVALLVLLLALGVVLARPDRGAPWGLPLRSSSARLVRTLLPAVVLVPTVFGWMGAGLTRPERDGADHRRALLVVAQVAALAAVAGLAVRRQHQRETLARRARGPATDAAPRGDQLTAHRRQLQHILRVLPAPFLVLDAGARVAFANPEAERFFRRPTGGLTGLSLQAVLGADDWSRVSRVLAEVRETHDHVSVTTELAGGPTVELRAFPADDGSALFVRELPRRLLGDVDARA